MGKDARLSGDRRSVRAAVLGSPIGHSLSPVLHLAAYAALGLTWWQYQAIECDEAGLSALLDSCGPDWVGLSLTMPLKRTVLPLLDRPDALVTEVGAANTVIFAAAQRLGYNTDVPGMVRALAERGLGSSGGSAGAAKSSERASQVRPPPLAESGVTRSGPAAAVGPVLILGGGATACSALAAIRDLGARSAIVAVRDQARTAELRSAASRLGVSITLRTLAPGGLEPADLAAARLIISTVPAGAADFLAHIYPASVRHPAAVFDVVYHPWPTPLAAAAQQAGAVVIGGFDLLLHQAAAQVELMTGRPAPMDAMRQAGLDELARRQAAV